MPLYRDAGLQLVVLFGSAARGQTGPRSDIDLAVLYDGRIDPVELTNRITQLLKTDAADVVDLRAASPLLQMAALRDGVVLYERSPGTFLTAYSLAFRRYVDTRKLREAQAAAIRSYLARQESA
jgi:predicted nucleotidyltransferase